jgi:hypothetical protein
MVRPTDQATIHLSLEQVNLHAGHDVLMEVDYNCALIARYPFVDFRLAAQASPKALINYCFITLIKY